jgi:hypothetical protein
VDTLRSDNVRGTPGEFQRGADPQGKRAASGWGDIPGAAPPQGLALGAKPGQSYAPRVNKMSLARMTALGLAAQPHQALATMLPVP